VTPLALLTLSVLAPPLHLNLPRRTARRKFITNMAHKNLAGLESGSVGTPELTSDHVNVAARNFFDTRRG
jgi:hypothetical protein